MTTHACDTLRCMTNPEVHAAVNVLADAAATAQSDLAHTTGETRNDLLEALADALTAAGLTGEIRPFPGQEEDRWLIVAKKARPGTGGTGVPEGTP